MVLSPPADIMSARGPDSDGESEHDSPSPPKSDMSMMRIAVAGTGGLARLIAHYIDEDTSHHVVFLSRQVSEVVSTSHEGA